MTKKHEKIIKDDGVNKNILNIITPSGVDFDRSHLNISQNVGSVVCISKYPSEADYGWLIPIFNLDGAATSAQFRYTSPDRLQKTLNKRISELKENYELAKNESDKQGLESAIKNLQELVNRITVKGEPVGYVNILIYATADEPNELKSRLKKVNTVLAISECGSRPLVYKQLQAFKTLSPYGIPDYDAVTNVGERAMPISTFLGGFPNASSGLNDTGGFYLGKSKDQKLIILDQWIRNGDRTNSNWFIDGVPGVGKSTFVKMFLMNEWAYGTKIIIFDPEAEYIELTKSDVIKGDVIDCSSGKEGRINPLEVRVSCRITPEEIDEEKDKKNSYLMFDTDTEGADSDLALYIQQLRLFFGLYFGRTEFTSDLSSVLEETLIELYRNKNITWDTDIGKLSPEDFPIMEELYYLAAEKAEKETNPYLKPIRSNLALKLKSCGVGADSFIWNGYTTLKPESDFIDLNVHHLLEADNNVKRAQFYNLIMWVWQQMSADRKRKVLFPIDELYLFVDDEFPEVMKYIRNISKRGRKYEASLMCITHSFIDVLAPSVKRYTQAIIDNACYKFLMGTDGKNLKETADLFDLSDKEISVLAAKARGQGVLMCGNRRMNMTVEVSDEMLELMGSAGGR